MDLEKPCLLRQKKRHGSRGFLSPCSGPIQTAVFIIPQNFIIPLPPLFDNQGAVGRESAAHPAFHILPSPDAERYHLPPIQGDKYRFERNGGSLNKASPQP